MEHRLPSMSRTESLVMENPEQVTGILQRLKEQGAGLSLDDFGTGHSSLAYLQRFPFDCIKIDQSFVRDMDSNADSRALVRAIVQMAHSLGLRTIAEGVERALVVEQLVALGCDEVQGYYYGRPVPPDEFGQFLARGPARIAA